MDNNGEVEKGGAHDPGGPILDRQFVIGFLAFFAFLMATFALIPTLPVFLDRLGTSKAEIGILIGIYGAAALLARLLVGGALLRYSERTVIIGGGVLFALTFLALLVFRPFWPIAVVRVFQGISFAAVDTAALAFVVGIVPPEQRGQALGYFILAPPFAQASAPAAGMFLLNRYGFVVLFIVCIALCVCSFLFSWKLMGRSARCDSPVVVSTPRRSRFFDRKIIAPAIPTFLHGIVWGSVIAFLPLYAIENRISNPGFYFTAVGAMLITGRSLSAKFLGVYRKETILPVCMLILMAAMVVLSQARNLPMLILVGLVWGSGSAFFFPTAMAYALEYAGSSDGTAVGTFRAFSDFGIAIGPTLMGFILASAGYRVMFLLLAATFLVNLVYFRFYLANRSPRT